MTSIWQWIFPTDNATSQPPQIDIREIVSNKLKLIILLTLSWSMRIIQINWEYLNKKLKITALFITSFEMAKKCLLYH